VGDDTCPARLGLAGGLLNLEALDLLKAIGLSKDRSRLVVLQQNGTFRVWRLKGLIEEDQGLFDKARKEAGLDLNVH
jgi:hypothetical protein